MNRRWPLYAGATLLGSAVLVMPALLLGSSALASAAPPLLFPASAVVFAVPTSRPLVALTIDDGPSNATSELLELLEEHEAHATFFAIGEHLAQAPELAGQIVASGHELAHHMTTDAPSIRLPAERFRTDFDRMDAQLAQLGGAKLFRPGSGWFNDRMVAHATARGYQVVLGSVYPFDAIIPSAAFHAWFIRRNVRAGAIIVLHEGGSRGRRTVDVLRDVLPELRRRGYRVVTVSELLRAADPVAGAG